MMEAVIVDVDGTMALMGKEEDGRRKPYDWHRVSEDDPNEPIIQLVKVFKEVGFRIIFVSGRDEICRDATIAWLNIHGFALDSYDELFMRKHKNNRSDDIIKMEIYKDHIEPKYNIRYVLDDRNRVVKMWRSLGLTVLQVADGDF